MTVCHVLNEIERHLAQGRPLEALILALGQRQALRASARPDRGEALAGLHLQRLRALEALGAAEEALDLIERPEPGADPLPPRQMGWLHGRGVVLAHALGRPAALVTHALEALRARVLAGELHEAEAVGRLALDLLRDLGALAHAEALLERAAEWSAEPPPGSPEALGAQRVTGALFSSVGDLPGGPTRAWELAAWQAASLGQRARLGALLRLGVDPAARVRSRPALPTALHVAASRGHVEVVGLLLDAGAPPDVVTAEGHAPLHVAADSGQLGVVRRLLAAGADPALADALGRTALHLAAWRGHRSVVRALQAAGADPAALDAAGLTPEALAGQRAP